MSSSYPGFIPQWLENNKTFFKDVFPSLPQPFHMAERREPMKSSGMGSLVLTCLDPRCVPETFFGPGFQGAVVRNAGGRATDDAVRSITLLRALAGIQNIVVVHHTDCGVTHLDSEEIIARAAEEGAEAKAAAEKIDYKLFTSDQFEEAIREDVRALKSAPSLAGAKIYGFKLDTFTGEVEPVET